MQTEHPVRRVRDFPVTVASEKACSLLPIGLTSPRKPVAESEMTVMNCRNLLLSSVASIIAAAFFFTGTTALFAEEPPLEPGGKVTVRIEDGTRVKGIVTGEDENFLILVTPAGVEVKIPKTAIVSRREAGELRPDPNYSRLMFAPTGRPLKKGEGYFSDYWVLFPGVAYGVTEHFSILAGFSVLPGVSLDEQAGYIAPRLGKCFTERFAASVGTMFASFGGELTAGIAFATATWGPLDRCLTAGLGIDYSRRRG